MYTINFVKVKAPSEVIRVVADFSRHTLYISDRLSAKEIESDVEIQEIIKQMKTK